MKKRASLLLVLPVFGAVLAGCSVPQPVKDGLRTVKDGVKNGVNKAIEATDNFFKESKEETKKEETEKKVEYRVVL